MSKITKELIAKARELAEDTWIHIAQISPGPADPGETHWISSEGIDPDKCLCGLGLLLKADGQNPHEYDTDSAMDHFELRDEPKFVPWSEFDKIARRFRWTKNPAVFNMWLDGMEKNYT